jgi:ribosome biogenesis GTPase / thiamine phosphate phosphatase
VDVFKDWQEGKDHQGPNKERWSREAKKARPKKAAKSTELILGEIFNALVVGMHRRTCELRFAMESDGDVSPQEALTVSDTLIDLHEASNESLSSPGASVTWDNHSDPLMARFSPTIDLGEESHLTVGDWVQVALESCSQEWYVTKLHSRISKLSRPGPPDREHREQLLAANIDRIVLVGSAADPAFNPGFVERYLMVAQFSEIPLVLVLNKIDLTEELPESLKELEPHIESVIYTSAKSGRGLRELAQFLEGKSSIFTGQSGVGKSTLIEALIPGIELDTTQVRERDGKGRHTTTTSTVFSLPQGGQVIDSPGIRGLGFWQLSRVELAWLYPLFTPWVDQCKFQDCLHDKEPQCQVLRALEEGELSQRAYESYLRMLDSLKDER